MSKWIDKEDEEIMIDLNQNKFQKLKRKIKKDKINISEYQDYFENFQNSNYIKWTKTKGNKNKLQNFIQKQKNYDNILEFKKDEINILKICKTNYEQKIDSSINANDFKNNKILIGGFDKILKIFKVENEKLVNENNIYFESMPILDSKFMNIKNEISLLSLNKPFVGFYDINKMKLDKLYKIFDFKYTLEKFTKSDDDKYMALLPAKNNGNISLISPINKQIIHEFKTNEKCNDLCINDKYLFASTISGKIYQYDWEQRKIFDIINDKSSINTTKIYSKSNKLVSGTYNGMVNIYNINNSQVEKDPYKSFNNLTYEINYLDIDCINNLLVFGSKWKDNSIRIANLNDNKILKNWPNVKTNIGKISAISMSSNNMISIGNDNGNLIVYKIN